MNNQNRWALNFRKILEGLCFQNKLCWKPIFCKTELELKLRIKMKMIEAFLHVDLLSPICRPVTTERVEIESKREERAQHWIAMNRIAASQLQFHSIILSSTLPISFSPSSRCSEFANYVFKTLSFKSF